MKAAAAGLMPLGLMGPATRFDDPDAYRALALRSRPGGDDAASAVRAYVTPLGAHGAATRRPYVGEAQWRLAAPRSRFSAKDLARRRKVVVLFHSFRGAPPPDARVKALALRCLPAF